MRTICRTLLAGSLLLPFAAELPWPAQATVDRTSAAQARSGKTVKECNAELQKNEAALEAAGESASAFFHACWWHSEKGKPTPITADKKDPPRADTEKVADTGSDHEAPPAVKHVARSRHTERRRYFERRFAALPRRHREETYAPAPASPAFAPVATSPAALPEPLPNQVNLNVPGVGSVAVPIVPVPGLAATVRDVVDHPVVPGLVTATP